MPTNYLQHFLQNQTEMDRSIYTGENKKIFQLLANFVHIELYAVVTFYSIFYKTLENNTPILLTTYSKRERRIVSLKEPQYSK